MNFYVLYNCKQNKSIDKMEVQIMKKKVKFAKARNKNIWKASTGAEIRYNIFFEQYDVETDRRFW